ncbi:MAG: hypothetical protein KAQ67_00495, partial [Gammaproteobacteria bacterium]|nr:hypothetical protein [Gammaproteobacteria bacterium]
LAVLLMAGMMSLGLMGCDSKECFSFSNCSGAPNNFGYTCDNAPTTCWPTLAECQASSQCE